MRRWNSYSTIKANTEKTYKKKEPVLYVVKRKHLTTSNTTNLQFKFYITDKIGFRPTWTDNLPKTTASVKIVTDVS